VALYSQRFWAQLGALDARVSVTLQRQRDAFQRLTTGRRAIVGATLHEFHSDLLDCSEAAQVAVTQLQRFCGGRAPGNSGAVGSAASGNRRHGFDT
jgi:hypothetical protein